MSKYNKTRVLKNLSNSEVASMVKYPNEKANEIGRRKPYHLQAAQEEKKNKIPHSQDNIS